MGLLTAPFEPPANDEASIGIKETSLLVNMSLLSTVGRRSHSDLRQSEHGPNLEAAVTNVVLGNQDKVRVASASETALSSMLRSVVPEAEAHKVASRLMNTFGSLGAVLASKGERLADVCSSNEACASLLRCVSIFMKAVLREPLEDRPIIDNTASLYDYLRLSAGHAPNEEIRILFLNTKNALLKDEVHSRGTLNHVPVYPREIIKRVLDVNAGAIILVHNHPSGDPTPSKDDVEMTKVLVSLLDCVGVRLHDHVIVGRHRCASMRSLGMI